MLNPFLNGHKSSIILSYSSNASEKAFRNNKKTTKTNKEENFFKLLEEELSRKRNEKVQETFELVA